MATRYEGDRTTEDKTRVRKTGDQREGTATTTEVDEM